MLQINLARGEGHLILFVDFDRESARKRETETEREIRSQYVNIKLPKP